MEEALAFFGSKLIDPSRNHFFETEFYRYYKKTPDEVERETSYSLQTLILWRAAMTVRG